MIGNVSVNCETGIYGSFEEGTFLDASTEFCRLAVANNSEIHKGSAYIMTSAIDGKLTKYDIEITQINKGSSDGPKALISKL